MDAIRPLQRARRRSVLLRNWKSAVIELLQRAHAAAWRVQCFIRSYQSMARARKRREEVILRLFKGAEEAVLLSIRTSTRRWDAVDIDVDGQSLLMGLMCSDDVDILTSEQVSGVCHSTDPDLDPDSDRDVASDSEAGDGDGDEGEDGEDEEHIAFRGRAVWAGHMLELLKMDLGPGTGSVWGVPPGCLLPPKATQ